MNLFEDPEDNTVQILNIEFYEWDLSKNSASIRLRPKHVWFSYSSIIWKQYYKNDENFNDKVTKALLLTDLSKIPQLNLNIALPKYYKQQKKATLEREVNERQIEKVKSEDLLEREKRKYMVKSERLN